VAVTLDFGKCAECGENNSKSVNECRKCGAPLPWAKKSPALEQSSSSTGSGFGGFSAGFYVQILGALIVVAGAFFWTGNVFGYHRTFPGLGYIVLTIGGMVWRGGAAMSD
jgi:hypothetical protein